MNRTVFLIDGFIVKLFRFKKKTHKCKHYGETVVRREEKETDVAIAARLNARRYMLNFSNSYLLRGIIESLDRHDFFLWVLEGVT